MGFIGNNPKKPKINLLRSKRASFAKADFKNEFTFEYKTKKGAKLQGYLTRRPSQRLVDIDDIRASAGGKEFKMGEHKAIAGKAAGARDIRGALGELRKKFPEVRFARGTRMTGTHASKLRKKLDANPTARVEPEGLDNEQKIKARAHKTKPMTLRQARTRRKLGSEIQKAFRLKGLGKVLPILAPLDAIGTIRDWRKAIHRNMLEATGGKDA